MESSDTCRTKDYLKNSSQTIVCKVNAVDEDLILSTAL